MLERSESGDFRLPPERAMAEMLGVSRPTVREAIQRLSSKGKLEIKQGSGIYIVKEIRPNMLWQQMSPEDEPSHADVTEFRRIHACLISRLAAKNANDEDTANLGRIISRIRYSASGGDLADLAVCNAEFHAAVIASARNTMLNRFLKKFKDTMQSHIDQTFVRAACKSGRCDARLREFVRVHESIYFAICEHDPDAAEMATIRHFEFIEALSECADAGA